MGQIVYYFFAAFRVWNQYGARPLYFSVPTGNFGDIFAGYMARKMGLPIEKLILATNENDILYRVLTTGIYEIDKVFPSLSPAMDIQVASNFERFLYDLFEGDSAAVESKMADLKKTGRFVLTSTQLARASEIFLPVRVNSQETLACIRQKALSGLVLDPHTAVGIVAAEKSGLKNAICLATAHAAKFQDTVEMACREKIRIPNSIAELQYKETRCLDALPNQSEIKRIIEEFLSAS